MREQLQARLSVLKQEFETGQTQLRDLERQQAYLRETLLRISGAIQVLEELLAVTNENHNIPSVNSNNIVENAHNYPDLQKER